MRNQYINALNNRCINALNTSIDWCIQCINILTDGWIDASNNQCSLIYAIINIFDLSTHVCNILFIYIIQSIHQCIDQYINRIYQYIDISMYLIHQYFIDVSIYWSMYRYINWLIQKLRDKCISAYMHLISINWIINTSIDALTPLINTSLQSIDAIEHMEILIKYFINISIDVSITLINISIYPINASVQLINLLI